MSASLVGSEMCIRDSFTGVLFPERTRFARLIPLERECWATRLRAHSRACLLYTSDAADDM
eukprot:6066150-Alexandrium_andersonii.AAC.1